MSRKVKSFWKYWISVRYLKGRKGGRGPLVFVFAVVLIAGGVTALNTILAIMNGLQLGYIRSILEIGSYHLRWVPEGDSTANNLLNIQTTVGTLNADPDVLSVIPFREGQTLLTGQRPGPSGALIRGVPESLLSDDPGLAKRINITAGKFDLTGNSIVPGEILARELGVLPGDFIQALAPGMTGLSPVTVILTVSGIYNSSYREYDSSLAFVSLNTSVRIFSETPLDIGIKLKNHERDLTVLSRLKNSMDDTGGKLVSWRDSNRGFFSALRTEKLMIFVLFALVFVVLAVNIDHSLRRLATERIEDLAVLKALGASPGNIRMIFLICGLFIGLGGGLSGSILGIVIGSNVDSIMNFFYEIIQFFPFQNGNSLIIELFQSTEILFGDVLNIFLLVVFLTLMAAIRASTLAAQLKPNEVLRSE